MNYYFTDELYHHGIKGQKWGVRKNYASIKAYKKDRKKFYKASGKNRKQIRKAVEKDIHNTYSKKAIKDYTNIRDKKIKNIVSSSAIAAISVYPMLKAIGKTKIHNAKVGMQANNKVNRIAAQAMGGLNVVEKKHKGLGIRAARRGVKVLRRHEKMGIHIL